MWIQVARPTPVLNTPHFEFAFGGKNGNEIPLGPSGHPYLNEFVALEGALFQVVREIEGSSVLEIVSPLYKSEQKLYIDRRFAKECDGKIALPPQMPSQIVLLQRMEALIGTPYLWGGNWSLGIPEMLGYYPPKRNLDAKMELLWTYRGIDCSGLLYEAARGATPRNTKELLSFGNALKISHLTIKEITKELKALDMILYPGHVLFVRDERHTIESKSPFGVIVQEIEKRLDELTRERRLVDEPPQNRSEPFFMIRRFLP